MMAPRRLLHRLLLVLPVVVLALLAGSPVHAQNNNASPRAAAHDGYGRMVFDWDGPVTYSAEVMNGELVVRFDRPVAGEFRAVLRPLAHYLRSVSVSADRRTATFPLARPVSVKAFTNASGATVVDLMDSDAAATPADEPAAAKTEAEPPKPEVAQGANAPLSLLPPTPPVAKPIVTPLPAPRPPAGR